MDAPTSERDDGQSIDVVEQSLQGEPAPESQEGTVEGQANPDETVAQLTQELEQLRAEKARADAIAAEEKRAADEAAWAQEQETRRRAAQLETQFVEGFSGRLVENGLTKEAEQFRGFSNSLRKRVVAAEDRMGRQQTGMESVIYAAQLLLDEGNSSEVFTLAETLSGIQDPEMRAQYGLDYVNHKISQKTAESATNLRVAELEAKLARYEGGINPADHLVDSGIGTRPTGKTWEEMDFDDVFAEASAGL